MIVWNSFSMVLCALLYAGGLKRTLESPKPDLELQAAIEKHAEHVVQMGVYLDVIDLAAIAVLLNLATRIESPDFALSNLFYVFFILVTFLFHWCHS